MVDPTVEAAVEYLTDDEIARAKERISDIEILGLAWWPDIIRRAFYEIDAQRHPKVEPKAEQPLKMEYATFDVVRDLPPFCVHLRDRCGWTFNGARLGKWGEGGTFLWRYKAKPTAKSWQQGCEEYLLMRAVKTGYAAPDGKGEQAGAQGEGP